MELESAGSYFCSPSRMCSFVVAGRVMDGLRRLITIFSFGCVNFFLQFQLALDVTISLCEHEDWQVINSSAPTENLHKSETATEFMLHLRLESRIETR